MQFRPRQVCCSVSVVHAGVKSHGGEKQNEKDKLQMEMNSYRLRDTGVQSAEAKAIMFCVSRWGPSGAV